MGRLRRWWTRDKRNEEKGLFGLEVRSFSARRREEDRTEGLVVEMAFSMVWAAKVRGLMRVGGTFWRKVEERWRRCSGWERVSEMKVEVWWRISAEVVVAAAADMVVVSEEVGGNGYISCGGAKFVGRQVYFCVDCK